MKQEIQRNYISETDRFLKHFDKTHPELSLSQQKEVQKHERIFQLRDHAIDFPVKGEFLDNF